MEGSIITVIAWDGTTLAVDSRITTESHIVCDSAIKLWDLRTTKKKVVALIDGGDKIQAVALAGASTLFTSYLTALQSNTLHEFALRIAEEDEEDLYLSGIIIGYKAVYHIEGLSPHFSAYPLHEPAHAGSGGIIAKSAMMLGLNAIEAVAHTIKIDHHCGGEVKSLRLYS